MRRKQLFTATALETANGLSGGLDRALDSASVMGFARQIGALLGSALTAKK